MPFHRLEHVSRVGDDDFRLGSGAVGELLAAVMNFWVLASQSDQASAGTLIVSAVLSVTQGRFVADRKTSLHGHVGLLGAQRPGKAGVRVGHEGAALNRILDKRTCHPVAAVDRIPGIGEQGGRGGGFYLAAFLALNAQVKRSHLGGFNTCTHISTYLEFAIERGIGLQVNRPNLQGILQCKREGLGDHVMALLESGEIASIQVIAKFLEGRIGDVEGKQRDALRAIRQVHFPEDGLLVTIQTIGTPSTRVYIPQAVRRVGADPEG